MLQYPSIPGIRNSQHHVGSEITAQYKYDGSSLRWEWSPGRGWHKFGTRRQLFDASTPLYNQAIEPFMNDMADVIVERVLQLDRKCQRITAFTEFFGDSSFAGSHDESESKQLKLLDVFLFKRGFLDVTEFYQLFQDQAWTPEIIYQGTLTEKFIDDVRNSIYPIVEGVICRGAGFSLKIKTLAYLAKLKAVFADNWERYGE